MHQLSRKQRGSLTRLLVYSMTSLTGGFVGLLASPELSDNSVFVAARWTGLGILIGLLAGFLWLFVMDRLRIRDGSLRVRAGELVGAGIGTASGCVLWAGISAEAGVWDIHSFCVSVFLGLFAGAGVALGCGAFFMWLNEPHL